MIAIAPEDVKQGHCISGNLRRKKRIDISIALYSLSEAYENVLNLIDEENPDIEILNALTTITDQIEVKAVNIANLIKSLDAEVEVIKAEEKRLNQRREARENASKSIKQYLQSNLEQLKMEKIKTPTRTIYTQKNPPSVEVVDIDKIPQKYLTLIPASYTARKDEIVKAWKDGEEIAGVVVTQGRSLRIK